MPDIAVLAQFERRLVELGCPARRLPEKVRELAEHHDDLKCAALEGGLSEQEATHLADEQLGHADLLAESTVAILRYSSWWGRHPIIGFCLLPLLAFIPVWIACGAILCGACWLLGHVFGPAYVIDGKLASVFSDDPVMFNDFVVPTKIALEVAAVLASVGVFCWLARRSGGGLKWMLTACAFCSINCYFSYAEVQPHNVTVGYWLGYWWRSPNWIYAGIPLVAGATIFLAQRRRTARLALAPMEKRSKVKGIIPRQSLARTPTYWVVAAAVLLLWGSAIPALTDSSIENSRLASLKLKVWPAERAATLAALKMRQAESAPLHERTVNLKRFQNATLLDSTDGPADVKENNLSELALGKHVFGGVCFDVSGKIQLLGQPLPKSRSKYPGRITGIPIAQKCAQIHLLHGASALDAPGRKIARLVLHYANGSSADIGIVGGEHVLDWWGPIYNTDAEDNRATTSPDTELAWAGCNPWISQRSSEFSLRLYRTTFANPHPDWEITSLDYVSTLSGAAPFLVGLTTEPTLEP